MQTFFSPVVQAPMAGVSTPELAAAVANAGGLGFVAVGHLSPAQAEQHIARTRERTECPFGVNVFCHRAHPPDAATSKAWLAHLGPEFARYQSQPPTELSEIYPSFSNDHAMFALLLKERPAAVSFHFGLPSKEWVGQLRRAGCQILASVTSLQEAEQAAQAGVQILVAQGYEAGGHRGVFDENGPDEQLSTLALTRLLVRGQALPVVAAGGIMDGAGVAAALRLGAVAAQLGTAYLCAPESAATYKDRVTRGQTTMTRLISGRPARCLINRFTQLDPAPDVPAYPWAYSVGKALHAAALKQGEGGYGAHWAGQGARMAQTLPAAEITAQLLQAVR